MADKIQVNRTVDCNLCKTKHVRRQRQITADPDDVYFICPNCDQADPDDLKRHRQ